jgi:hypothetical protein
MEIDQAIMRENRKSLETIIVCHDLHVNHVVTVNFTIFCMMFDTAFANIAIIAYYSVFHLACTL